MTEFSDYTNSYIIITLLLFFYLYLSYLKISIIAENEWEHIKCTPLYMLLGTFMGQGSDDNVFRKCIKKNTKRELEDRQIKSMKRNEEKVDYNTKRMNSLLDVNDNSINHKQQELLTLVEGSNETIEKQNKINEAIMNTSGPIQNTFGKIEDIVEKGKEIYTEFDGKLN